MSTGLDFFPGSRVDPAQKPNDRYTLRPLLEWCRKTADVERYDLDVAACAEAHCAPDYCSLPEDDGLISRWRGNVWCNPPYDDPGAWVRKAWAETQRGGLDPVLSISMLLPGNRQEQPWWQEHVEPFRDGRFRQYAEFALTTHYVPVRQKFGHPGNPLGVGAGQAPFCSVLLVWRRR